MSKHFGPLYALASNGKTKLWKAHVRKTSEGYGFITYTFGYEDGVHQHQEKVVKVGKNIGKSNETTPYAQAYNDAESKCNRKQDEGYQEDKTTLMVPLLPMLAHTYEKRKHNIEWPCFVQPKIDGIRCTVGYKNGKVCMFTRKGKSMTPMIHIEKHLERLFAQAKALDWDTDHLYFDGELYSNDLTFQELAGTLRRHKNTQETLNKIYLVVFDMFWTNIDTPYKLRKESLEELDKYFKDDLFYIEFLLTEEVSNEEEMKEKHGEYAQQGYEGIMLRNKKGNYKIKHRSADLQKLKMMNEEEFTIFGGKQDDDGGITWRCQTKEGRIFWARSMGSLEQRTYYLKNIDKFIGQKITIIFQELTDEGIPRFPRAKIIRTEKLYL